jgi:septal ring factor EnvC (AmiA/AmiB activator)
MLEEKLLQGGEVISKASKQEGLLRKAEQELRERQQQESRLARELAEKEEANLQLEEHFSSLQEEVEVKTKKLKKLWAKYQGAVREAQDLQEEFQVRSWQLYFSVTSSSCPVPLLCPFSLRTILTHRTLLLFPLPPDVSPSL